MPLQGKKQIVLLGEIYCIFVVDFMGFSFLHLKSSCISWLNSMIFQVIVRNSPLVCVKQNISIRGLSRVDSGILWLDVPLLQVEEQGALFPHPFSHKISAFYFITLKHH